MTNEVWTFHISISHMNCIKRVVCTGNQCFCMRLGLQSKTIFPNSVTLTQILSIVYHWSTPPWSNNFDFAWNVGLPLIRFDYDCFILTRKLQWMITNNTPTFFFPLCLFFILKSIIWMTHCELSTIYLLQKWCVMPSLNCSKYFWNLVSPFYVCQVAGEIL